MDAVNLFSELRDVWERYATIILMFISIQYAVIIVMLCAVFLKYGMLEFYIVLLSAVFVDLYGIADRKYSQEDVRTRCYRDGTDDTEYKHFTSCV